LGSCEADDQRLRGIFVAYERSYTCTITLILHGIHSYTIPFGSKTAAHIAHGDFWVTRPTSPPNTSGQSTRSPRPPKSSRFPPPLASLLHPPAPTPTFFNPAAPDPGSDIPMNIRLHVPPQPRGHLPVLQFQPCGASVPRALFELGHQLRIPFRDGLGMRRHVRRLGLGLVVRLGRGCRGRIGRRRVARARAGRRDSTSRGG